MKHVIPLSALVLSFSALAAAGNIKCVANHGAADLNMPENSLAAFSNAVQRASEIVNLAVRATKDDVPVISHDASLKRTMNWDVKIAARTYKDILATGSYQWNGENSGYKIATLGEALDIVKDIPEFWLDIKVFTPRLAEKAIHEFTSRGISKDRIMCATSNYAAFPYLHDKHPGVRLVAQITTGRSHNGKYTCSLAQGQKFNSRREMLDAILAYVKAKELYGVSMPAAKGLTLPDDVTYLKKNGVWVALWLVQDPLTAALYQDCAPDAFVTDHASRLR